MKKANQLIALALSFTLLLCFLPVFSFAYAESDGSDGSDNTYINSFDVDGDLSEITKDFKLYFDTKDSTNNSLVDITADPSNYMTFANNRLERVFDADTELYPWDNGNRPYWCMAYYTYKNQIYKNFELSVDAHMPSWGTSYYAITVGSMGNGLKSNGGFTLGFQTYDSNLFVYLGSASDVGRNFDDWYIHDCTGKSSISRTSDDNYKIELKVYGGLASVIINGTAVLSNINVGEVNGYISLASGIVTGAYYDNLTIISKDISTFERIEKAGKYSNNFDVSGNGSLITGDFNLYYDTTETHLNSLSNITTSYSKYITFAKDRLERVVDDSELRPWEDGNRPYWCMAYYTYKNQTFKNFKLTVDAYMPDWGTNYNAITVGSMGDGLKTNGGYTLGFCNASSSEMAVYIGSAADVAVNFDDWYIHDCEGKATIARKADNTYKIELNVSGGRAFVLIDGTAVLTNIDVGSVSGYVSLVNGLSTGSYYDNLTIAENVPEYERVEDDGKYSNNFNVDDDISKLTADFNFYHDTKDSNDNTLVDITSDPSKYLSVSGNNLTRIFDPATEFNPWQDGNRPYWCMAYYTYKNQTFRDFTLTVDAYMPIWGTNFNAITVGSMGGGLKSNGGFTLGFGTLASKTELAVYIGSATDVAANFDDWYIHDCAGKAIYTHENGNFNYKIALTVVDGNATVVINGTTVLSNIPVDVTDGYVSLVNGIADGSYYDNLSIIDYDKVEIDPELQSTILSIEEVEDIEWNRTEDNSNTMNLPEKLKVTTDKGEKELAVKWTSNDYKPSMPGAFKFIGTPVLPVDKTIINPHNIVAESTVTVTVDYDTSTTLKYYIDSLDDFKSNWVSLYSTDPRSEDFASTAVESLYYIDDGKIRRRDSAGNVGDHDEMVSLVYTGRTFRNFQLDVDFRQGGNTWGQAMVTFGIEDPMTYVTLPGGGAATYLTMEGNARFRGNLIENTNSNGEVAANSNFADYANTWSTEMHHMTLRVTKLKAVLEIDGVEVLECALDSSYEGGYIGFMSNKNTAMYDNLTVTALDYDGNVITLEEHDNLPDTFDPNDPLIGEETDDGTPTEIIGIDYKTNPNNKYLSIEGTGSGSSSDSGTSDGTNTDSILPTGDDFPLYILVSVLMLSCLAASTSHYLKRRSDELPENKQ